MIEMFGTEAVVFAPKELSWLTAREFCQSVARAIALNPEIIVIDLAYVDFCDDTGLAVLTQALRGKDAVQIRNTTSAVHAAEEQAGVELPRPRAASHDKAPRHVGPFWMPAP